MIKDVKATDVVSQANDLYNCTALAGEVGELCNFIKKENRKGGWRLKHDKDVEMEIPDILYYTIKIAIDRGIDIERIWDMKLNHNEIKYGRPITDRNFECDCDECVYARSKM